MAELSWFSRVGIAGVSMAAIVEAGQEALAGAPDVRGFLHTDLSGSWNYVPLTFLSVGAFAWASGKFYRSIAGPNGGPKLEIVHSSVFATQDPSTEFKRKLYIVVRNTGDEDIVLGPGTVWLNGELSIRAIPQQVWEAEPANGGWKNGVWKGGKAEMLELGLRPGQAARTWVGLHENATQAEYEALKGRAGKLIVPIQAMSDAGRLQLQL